MRRSTAAALLMLALGAAVVALLVRAVGLSALRDTLWPVRRAVPLLLLPYAGVYVLDALGWYFALGATRPRVGALGLFTLRMAGESINNVTPLGYMGGEPAKALLLARHGISVADGLASVVIAKTLMTLAQVVFVVAGLAAVAGEAGERGSLAAGIAIVTALMAMGTAAVLALQRRGLFASLLRLLDALRLGRAVPGRVREGLAATDRRLSSFYRERRRDFALSFGCFLLGWLAGVPEVLVALSAMGQEIAPLRALAIEALATVVKVAGFLVPGSLGAQEAGLVALLASLGYSPEVGLGFSLLRRAREILWIAFGLVCLAFHSRARTTAAET